MLIFLVCLLFRLIVLTNPVIVQFAIIYSSLNRCSCWKLKVSYFCAILSLNWWQIYCPPPPLLTGGELFIETREIYLGSRACSIFELLCWSANCNELNDDHEVKMPRVDPWEQVELIDYRLASIFDYLCGYTRRIRYLSVRIRNVQQVKLRIRNLLQLCLAYELCIPTNMAYT